MRNAAAGRAAGKGKREGLLDPHRGRHLRPGFREVERPEGRVRVLIDEAESPLAWLARRKGRDGQPLVTPVQLQAGERLRADFTRAHLTPRVTSNWDATATPGGQGGGRPSDLSDMALAAKQRMRQALSAAGPEFSGLLLDVCCFLKGLEAVERERQWPPRSAKVVLQLGLDRLARHYGFAAAAQGRAGGPIRAWTAEDRPAGIATDASPEA